LLELKRELANWRSEHVDLVLSEGEGEGGLLN
jgi:hypothetical protein